MQKILGMIRQDWRQIPQNVKRMSLMLFLLVFGRGLGGDVFFSVYIDSIVDNALMLSLLGSGLAFVKMILSLVIGDMEDRVDFAKILQGGKWIYIICGLFFAAAGYFENMWFLYVAILLNGIANPMVFTTYTYYFGINSNKHNRYAVLGLLNSASYVAYVLGALLAAVLVQYLDMRMLFLFVPIFTGISMLGWKRLENDVDDEVQSLTERLGVRRQVLSDLFSMKTYAHSMNLFKDHGLSLLSRLGLISLVKGLDYVGFLFIPVLAMRENFSLTQVALVFAAMRVFPMLSYFVGDAEDNLPYKTVLLGGLGGLFLSFLGLAIATDFYLLLFLGILMGMMLTVLRPLIAGDILSRANQGEAGATTGLMSVFSKVGEIIGSLLFGTIAAIFSMQYAFGFFAVVIFVVFLVFMLTFKEKSL